MDLFNGGNIDHGWLRSAALKLIHLSNGHAAFHFTGW